MNTSYTTPHGMLISDGRTASFNPTKTGPLSTDVVAPTEEEILEAANVNLKAEIKVLEEELARLRRVLDE